MGVAAVGVSGHVRRIRGVGDGGVGAVVEGRGLNAAGLMAQVVEVGGGEAAVGAVGEGAGPRRRKGREGAAVFFALGDADGVADVAAAEGAGAAVDWGRGGWVFVFETEGVVRVGVGTI